MDVIETQVQRTSPILRVTTDISEFKTRDSKEDIRTSETTRSTNSRETNLRHASSLLQKKKQLRPLLGSPNPYRSSSYYASSAYSIHPNSKSNVSAFTQRIMSAKLLRVKQLQNELKDTQIQLHEAKNENRLLRTLQKRQDNALKKYDGDQAQLPQLIKSHNEELRVISTQYKQLKSSYRELEQKLRQRETELDNLKEQHRHLVKLSRDKQLGLRERLTKQVEDLQETVKEQNERIQVLTRRVELESKNHKHQLNVEMTRHKETHLELTMAHETIESLKNLIEAKDKYINNTVPNRFYKPPGNTGIPHQAVSATNTRFRNIPKTAGPVIIQGKRDSEETASFDHAVQDSDATSELSSANQSLKNCENRMKTISSHLNLRKKLTNKKLRLKSNQIRPNLPSKGRENEVEDGDEDEEEENNENHDDDTETPHYSSSFPSINNSIENSKYNTSESDTITKMSSIKTKRRVSIDSCHTVISDNTSPNNEGDDFEHDDDVDNDCGDDKTDDNSCNSKKDDKFKKKNVINKRNNKKDKFRRNSVSICESDGPIESISSSLIKAQTKDRLMRQKSIKDELKELEEKLKINNQSFTLGKNNSFDSLFDQKSQSVKDELKEFEERLLNSTELRSYSSSISKTFEEEADKVVKKVTTGLAIINDSNSDNDSGDDKVSNRRGIADISEEKLRKKFGFKDISATWNTVHDDFHREREQTESLLDEYYEKMMANSKNDDYKFKDHDEELKANVKLDDDEKVKLLKALNRIDREEGGRKDSFYSSDSEPKDCRNSLNVNYKYDLNSSDNLNNIKSSYDFEFPKINNIDNLEGEFSQDFDKFKSKTDLMEKLFGNSHPFKNKQENAKSLGNT